MTVVMIIKAAVSPYTPPPAYIAVAFQGFLGEFLFRKRFFFSARAIIFGLITMIFSAFQKVAIYTLIFGYNLWDSVDKLGEYVTSNLPVLKGISELSLWIIGVYVFIHLIVGTLAGITAARLPKWIAINEFNNNYGYNSETLKVMDELNKNVKRKKKPFYKKLSNIFIFLLVFTLIILSYVFPHFSKSTGAKAVIMVIRYIIIMFIWLNLLSPWLIKSYKNYFNNKKGKYSEEIETTIEIFPVLKGFVLYKWRDLKGENFFKKIKLFIIAIFIFVLNADLTGNKQENYKV